jgi:murein DD-endopeptidase MepM/ murein hydrolase activator NlpD
VPDPGQAHPTARRVASVVVLALVVLLSSMPLGTPPTSGRSGSGSRAGLGPRIAETRRAQVRVESAMRARDRRIRTLERRRATVRAQLRQQRARLRDVREARRATRAEAGRIRQRLANKRERRSRVRATASRARLSRAVRRLDARLERLAGSRVRLARTHRRVLQRVHRQERRVQRVRDRLRTVRARRARTEARLAGRIGTMTRLAHQRAAWRAAVRPGRPGSRLAWPLQGRITQAYGCTGFRLARRRGSCRHFHAGIDIAARPGRRVRAAATGVVAYVGWAPQDRGRRAFVVVVAHAGGLVTRYAHLRPKRRVWAGQFVRRGQVIGLTGNTGRTTGPHLHWEVIRRGRLIDPRAVTVKRRR